MVSLLIDPTNPQVVYAGTEGPGAVKTTDGGATWIGVDHGPIGTGCEHWRSSRGIRRRSLRDPE